MSEHSDKVIWLQSELDEIRAISARQAHEIEELKARLRTSDAGLKSRPEFVLPACDKPGFERRIWK